MIWSEVAPCRTASEVALNAIFAFIVGNYKYSENKNEFISLLNTKNDDDIKSSLRFHTASTFFFEAPIDSDDALLTLENGFVRMYGKARGVFPSGQRLGGERFETVFLGSFIDQHIASYKFFCDMICRLTDESTLENHLVGKIIDNLPQISLHPYIKENSKEDKEKNRSIRDFNRKNISSFFRATGLPYKPTISEYRRYILTNIPQLQFKTYQGSTSILINTILNILLPSRIDRSYFNNHTYIVGGSGSGKSELIRTIGHFIGENTVVIDPHGDLAREMGKTAYNIEPHARRFVINPFDIEDRSDKYREIAAQEITDLLREMIRDVGLSSLMETIAFPVIYTLLKLPYSDFRMFAECMNPKKGKARLRALREHVDPILHAEIWDELEADTYDTSKQSLFNRLQGFLNKRAILETVCGRDDFKNYFDLEKGVVCNNIVVNLAGLGNDVCETIGRMFMTRMQIWAKNRQRIPESKRTPVFLIVDEFQNFIGEHLSHTLEEYGRKFKLYLTLAHQHVGQISVPLRGAIMANMKNKIAGVSDMTTRQKVAQEMGIDADVLDRLKAGHFYGRFVGGDTFPFYARKIPSLGGVERVFCASANGSEIVNGWDGFDLDEDGQEDLAKSKNTRSPKHDQAPGTPPKPRKKYTPKFDL